VFPSDSGPGKWSQIEVGGTSPATAERFARAYETYLEHPEIYRPGTETYRGAYIFAIYFLGLDRFPPSESVVDVAQYLLAKRDRDGLTADEYCDLTTSLVLLGFRDPQPAYAPDDGRSSGGVTADARASYIGPDRQLSARRLSRTFTDPNGNVVTPQEFAANFRGSPSLRGDAGIRALEELYPGGIPETFQTQWGARNVDYVVRRNGIIYAFESKNFSGPLRGRTHELQEVLKDWELMQTEQGYTPIWIFWDAGPSSSLAQTLDEFGIRYVVYNP
jgi:hypothetical protein